MLSGTVDTDIMGMFTPATLPILSGLAQGYAVCDQWFSSVPTAHAEPGGAERHFGLNPCMVPWPE